jgi:hypothetical protein
MEHQPVHLAQSLTCSPQWVLWRRYVVETALLVILLVAAAVIATRCDSPVAIPGLLTIVGLALAIARSP